MKTGLFATDRWKKTSLGNDISLFASHSFQTLAQLRPILLIGGVHGDEPEGVSLAESTLSWLKTKSVEEVTPWVLIPCLNVDGYKRNERVNGRGVDLNRNYPSQNWSPKFDKPRYFPGPHPASEPEVIGVVELIQTFHPRLMIHCHSWEPCIVATGERAQTDGKYLADSCGYELKEEIGYPTPGSLSAYGWDDHKIPVICIEERDKLQDLSTIWPRFEKGMRSVFLDRSERLSV